MKIPKYVREFAEQQRIVAAPISEQSAEGGVYGYIFRLYLRSNGCFWETLENEAERLAAWARREYADAKVLDYFDTTPGWNKRMKVYHFTVKEHRKPYYKRDYVLISITDPVAQQLEKLIAQTKRTKI